MAGWLVPFGVYMGLQEYLGRRQDARLAELDEQEKALSEKMEALDKKAEALRAANTSS
jgi:cell division protein FtsB